MLPRLHSQNFNPRPPRGERQYVLLHHSYEYSEFQSTPSARRATWPIPPHGTNCKNFNPRPPRGGRPTAAAGGQHGRVFQSTPSARRATLLTKALQAASEISIHALREEGDMVLKSPVVLSVLFQSTPSARRATRAPGQQSRRFSIFQSTPSARRATHSVPISSGLSNYFNPRPPRGGRPCVV